MRGPHRKQQFRQLCADAAQEPCRRHASVACLRCGAPLCDRHVPAPDRRCDACEKDFFATKPDRLARLRTESRVVSAASVAGGLSFGVASGLSALAVAGFTVLAFGMAHWLRVLAHLSAPERAGVGALAEQFRRRRFLRERSSLVRRPRRLLGA